MRPVDNGRGAVEQATNDLRCRVLDCDDKISTCKSWWTTTIWPPAAWPGRPISTGHSRRRPGLTTSLSPVAIASPRTGQRWSCAGGNPLPSTDVREHHFRTATNSLCGRFGCVLSMLHRQLAGWTCSRGDGSAVISLGCALGGQTALHRKARLRLVLCRGYVARWQVWERDRERQRPDELFATAVSLLHPGWQVLGAGALVLPTSDGRAQGVTWAFPWPRLTAVLPASH